MSDPAIKDILNVAIDAAVLGGRRTLAYYNAGVEIETKADQTPVTRADREAEEVIRGCIQRYFPGHAIIGEEAGVSAGDERYRWIIDPIDGTKSFIRGVPFYGVLIGVEVLGVASVGVIYFPALNELVTGAPGFGCQWNGRAARVSTVSRLEDATLLTTSISSAMARSDAWQRLASRTKLQRTWGDCYGYAMVATGRADVMIDPAMKPWDSAPLLPILREAGGHYTAWDGRATIWGADGCGTNGALNAEVLDVLKTEVRRGTN